MHGSPGSDAQNIKVITALISKAELRSLSQTAESVKRQYFAVLCALILRNQNT